MADAEFQSVLAAAKAGEDSAWRGLVEHYTPALLAYVRRVGAGDPEDALAELWLSAARSIGSFEGEEPAFRSWLFVIAHRRAIDEGRRAARRATPLGEMPEATDPSASPAERLLDSVESDAVHRLLERLTPDQRAVVLLRVMADASLRETAQILGKRVGAVKALQRRALETLRNLLDDDRFLSDA